MRIMATNHRLLYVKEVSTRAEWESEAPLMGWLPLLARSVIIPLLKTAAVATH